MRIAELTPADLPSATELLVAALPWDGVGVVAAEKLFGENGARQGRTWGAWRGELLVGVAAMAGRWIKILAVAPSHTRDGVGSTLLAAVRASGSEARLRVGDHPGNYLSPGLDVRYDGARSFFLRHGFALVGEVENLRAPLDDNPLVTADRQSELIARTRALGYVVQRATAADEAALLQMTASAFSPVWAHEIARALAGPRRAVHVALHNNQPVAFAAADGNNQGLGRFVPAGTLPDHRGKGLGEALLLGCLLDVRGLPEGGVIAWVGPKPFYARACGAVVERRFLQLEAG